MNKWWRSSADPEKISLTLKALVPLIIFGLGLFNVYTITENDLYELIQSLIVAISSIGVLYGLARKLYLRQ